MTKFIKLKVHPDSRKEKIDKKQENSFEIWVKAPAERGMANISALNLLGKETGISSSRFRIIKGARSPAKIIQVFDRSER